MASPSFNSLNHESLFVSPSPVPVLLQHSNQWDRPSAPPRNPSFTLPPPIPSAQAFRQALQHPQPDPTLYQNHYFSGQASGSNGITNVSNSRHQLPEQQSQHSHHYPVYQAHFPQPNEEPQLPYGEPPPPSPSIPDNLTPSRFDLPNGENYLSSTPDGGWNFDFSEDAPVFHNQELDLDYNWDGANNNNINNNNHDAQGQGQRQAEVSGGSSALEDYRQQIQILEARRVNRWEPDNPERAGAIDLTTSPIMPRQTARSSGNGRKRAAPNANSPSDSQQQSDDISPPRAKRTKTSQDPVSQPAAEALADPFGSPGKEDEVDLVNVDNDEEYAEAQRKRREESETVVKLASQQCVICLDQPEGLTVTHCGMSPTRHHYPPYPIPPFLIPGV